MYRKCSSAGWVGVQVANSGRVSLEEVEAHGRDSPRQSQDGREDRPDTVSGNQRGPNDRCKLLALAPVNPAIGQQDGSALHGTFSNQHCVL